ncbi:hypothetical protein H072_5881 [Dactylellina haptotyla CBS 200.50]|uniref:DASH complex subunit SPC34 n=1 Tax=Dactylellina haptotyla (strain CBS 200.50) TaxID=1284197 RepID=S8BLP7_DACHA|nr:hypothetical protein H072_5881 [Dactylellina haptotyla CBS 200.50]
MAVSGRFERHLEQIEAAAADISSMRFSEPGTFTNSQVNKPPITSLIRDTSPYERVLFSSSNQPSFASRGPMLSAKSTLLSTLLDGTVMHQVRSAVSTAHLKGDVDVELLLQGAENLARIYPTPGLDDKIEHLRAKYNDLQSSVLLHEELVTAQRTQLDLQRGAADHHDEFEQHSKITQSLQSSITEAEIEAEELAIQQLDMRRVQVESDIRDLDRRLGGIMPSKGF